MYVWPHFRIYKTRACVRLKKLEGTTTTTTAAKK